MMLQHYSITAAGSTDVSDQVPSMPYSLSKLHEGNKLATWL
jgi:hypothetical protein